MLLNRYCHNDHPIVGSAKHHARQGKARQGKASRRFDNLMAGMPSSGMQQKMQNSSNITHQRSLRAADVAVHTRQRKAVTGVCCRECTGPCT